MRKSQRNNTALTIFFLFFSASLFFSCRDEKPKTNATAEQSVPNVPANSSLADAHTSTENLLITDSLNTGLRTDLALSYYGNKEFVKAIRHLLVVQGQDKKNAIALITLGNVYYDTEQDENAIVFYEKALQLEKFNYNVRCDMATCYRRLKKPEIAIRLLKENIKMNYSHAQSHYNLSVIYKEAGKINEAEEEMSAFQKLNSGNNSP